MADCACGYTINKTAENAYAIFTNMLESDFLHTYEFDTETAYGMGWIPQNYAQTNNSGPSVWDWGGEGIRGGDPGLQLWVRSEMMENEGVGYVPTAEIVSARDDILYGSFRIAMKTTNVNGTCAAFFFYRNDTQEIDVEILSAQQFASSTQWPVNLIVQNTSSPLAVNGSGPQSSNYEYYMARQPDGNAGWQYREYRFDWLPDRIDYYVDGWHALSFTDNVPSSPGAIHFSHWSNGNPLWTHGPPLEDAVMTVAYVKAYFNATGPAPLSNHDCTSAQWRAADQGLCEVPNQYTSPWPGGPKGNETGYTYFFSRQDDIDRNTTSPDDNAPQGDLIHDPSEGVGVSFFEMRQKSLYTTVAVVLGSVVVALLIRLV